MDLTRIVKTGFWVFLVFLTSLLLWMFLYGRPKLVQYQVLFAVEGEPTAQERDRTIRILRERLREFAPPDWRAGVWPQMDGTILLMYRKSRGPGELAESIAPRGVCEFRFMEAGRKKREEAARNGPPAGYELVDYLETYRAFDKGSNEVVRKMYPMLVLKEKLIEPTSFKRITFWTKGIGKYTHILFEFHPDDAERLAEAYRRHPKRAVAIIVDGLIRIGVRNLAGVENGSIEPVGLLDNAQIEKVVKILRTGPLPYPLKIKKRMSRVLD